MVRSLPESDSSILLQLFGSVLLWGSFCCHGDYCGNPASSSSASSATRPTAVAAVNIAFASFIRCYYVYVTACTRHRIPRNPIQILDFNMSQAQTIKHCSAKYRHLKTDGCSICPRQMYIAPCRPYILCHTKWLLEVDV